MPWIPFTTNDVSLRQDVIEQVTAAAGRGDLLPPIVAGVIREIVGKVAVRNPVGEDGTIPDELLDAAKAMAAFRFIAQAQVDELLTKGITDRNAQAIALLNGAASGDLRIVPPENYAPVQAQSPSPRISPRRANYAPENFDGI